MRLSALQILRCPFCGGAFALEKNRALELKGDEMLWGVIWCECSAFPVVDGIPYLRPGAKARDVLALLESWSKPEALAALLDIAPDVQCPSTFREALRVLCRGPEADYLLHRFSDPTFLVSDGLLRAVPKPEGRCLDLCGGTGHLARSFEPDREVWLADLEFWKLWLAKRNVATECFAVCCDASQPLPFARGAFSFVFSSDGLNYIWHKRLFIAEATRLLGPEGLFMLTHLHNALCENYSPGMPLTPASYRALFETLPARLFKESEFLENILQNSCLDLSPDYKDAELQAETALIVIASNDPGIFRAHHVAAPTLRNGTLAINPLYEVERRDPKARLRLRFPSEYYEQEFRNVRRYLPEELELDTRDLNDPELIAKRVVLCLPDNY